MHKLQPSTNQLVSVARVYPKPHSTEYGSLMGFAWFGFLATLSTSVSTEGGPLHTNKGKYNTNLEIVLA